MCVYFKGQNFDLLKFDLPYRKELELWNLEDVYVVECF